jgi:hypothetical protein
MSRPSGALCQRKCFARSRYGSKEKRIWYVVFSTSSKSISEQGPDLGVLDAADIASAGAFGCVALSPEGIEIAGAWRLLCYGRVARRGYFGKSIEQLNSFHLRANSIFARSFPSTAA